MPQQYEASTTINAPIERIWDLLTDANAYPDWNTGVIGVDGDISDDSTIELTATISPKRAFKIKVADVQAPTSMRWASGTPLGLFTGSRTFRLTPNGDAVEFHTREEFSGPLAGMICKRMPDLTESFEQWCADLRSAAEAV